ncbi:MAG: hypothetical protein NT154_15035 [Verrucomicrobia bacterium]|nr:hypothetical protein [Verrucomicrobiota bacterium]
MSSNHIENKPRIEAADTHKLRTYFQDVDEQAVKVLAERYGHLVPPERLEHMANQPTHFETPTDFEKNYRAAFGQPPEPGLAGYTERGHPAHVSTEDMAGVPETVVHERLHQLADPQAERILGTNSAGWPGWPVCGLLWINRRGATPLVIRQVDCRAR